MAFLCGYPISCGVPGWEAWETTCLVLATCCVSGPMGTADDEETLRPGEEDGSGDECRRVWAQNGTFCGQNGTFRGHRHLTEWAPSPDGAGTVT